ncbi:MAG TPA: hypothetical protein VF803_01950 [Candidatus Paceibacterota bacterium]
MKGSTKELLVFLVITVVFIAVIVGGVLPLLVAGKVGYAVLILLALAVVVALMSRIKAPEENPGREST